MRHCVQYDSLVLDFIHDSIATHSQREQTFQLSMKGLSDSRIDLKKQDPLADSSLQLGAELLEVTFESWRMNDMIPRLQRLVPQASCENSESFLFLHLF